MTVPKDDVNTNFFNNALQQMTSTLIFATTQCQFNECHTRVYT